MSTEQSPGGSPLCSVIVVTWNRRKELEPLLDSVFAQSLAGHLEVIVVDNASSDDTIAFVRQKYGARVRVLAFEENRGASVGRNAGILAARAPAICFLDSDAEIISPNAIEKCLAHLDANPGTDAVAAPIWFDREKTRPFLLGGYVTPDGHYHGISCRSRDDAPMLLSTCFAVWRRATLVEVGGFDSWYFWGIEDMDLGLRTYFRRQHQCEGTQPFAIVRGIDVLHEMADTGRHHDWKSFEQTFLRYERQRLYMVLAYGGAWHFLRVLLRGPFRVRRMEEAWERKLTPLQRLQAAVLFPLMRLAALPKNIFDVRRNHLHGTPAPREVTDQ